MRIKIISYLMRAHFCCWVNLSIKFSLLHLRNICICEGICGAHCLMAYQLINYSFYCEHLLYILWTIRTHRWRGSKIVGFSQNAQWLEPLAIRILDKIETFYPISLIDSDKYGKSFLIDFFDPLSNTAHVWHFPFKLINHNLKKSYQSVSKTIFPEFRRLSYVHLVLSSLRLLTSHTDSEWFTNRK